jgi:predicted ferric reductase
VVINGISDSFSTSYGVFSSLGKIFALIGFVLYAINLLLAVKRQWLENFFEGLNRVYIAHHITGGISLALLVFHPFFLAVRYIDVKVAETFGESARFLWIRAVDTSAATYAEVQDAISVNAGIIAFWGMVILLILTLFIKLPYQIWLFTHRFLGVAFLFSLLHIITISSDTSQSALLKWYLIAWGIIGTGAFLYRSVLGSIIIKTAHYRVSKVMVSGPMTMIELQPVGQPIKFKAGQFIFIRFRWAKELGISEEYHPFSIASGPQENGVRLYVKALGDYTKNIQALTQGTFAEIEGAFGRFVPARYGNSPQVWIAGGIGVTPFISMARSMHDTVSQVFLIYSVATRSEMVEEQILREFLPQNFPNFTFIPYITDERDGKFLTADFVEEQVGGLNDKQIFVCGPPVMMKSMRTQLRAKSVPNRKIHSEEFSMS